MMKFIGEPPAQQLLYCPRVAATSFRFVFLAAPRRFTALTFYDVVFPHFSYSWCRSAPAVVTCCSLRYCYDRDAPLYSSKPIYCWLGIVIAGLGRILQSRNRPIPPIATECQTKGALVTRYRAHTFDNVRLMPARWCIRVDLHGTWQLTPPRLKKTSSPLDGLSR